MLLANMAVSRLQNTLDLTDVMLKSPFPLTASTVGCRTIIVRALGYAFAQMCHSLDSSPGRAPESESREVLPLIPTPHGNTKHHNWHKISAQCHNPTSIPAHFFRILGLKVSVNEFAVHGPKLASNQRLDVVDNHIGKSTKQLRNNRLIKTLVPILDIPLYEDDLGLRVRNHEFLGKGSARHVSDCRTVSKQIIEFRTAIRFALAQEFRVDGFHPRFANFRVRNHVETVGGVLVAEGLQGGFYANFPSQHCSFGGGQRSCKIRFVSREPLLQINIIAKTRGSAAACTYA